MDIKDLCDAGGDIMDSVMDAINRNDYSRLGDDITHTVNRVVDEVKTGVKDGIDQVNAKTQDFKNSASDTIGQNAGWTRAGDRNSYRNRYRENGQNRNARGSGTAAGQQNPGGNANGNRTAGTFGNRESRELVINRRLPGRVAGPLRLSTGIVLTTVFGVSFLLMILGMILGGFSGAGIMGSAIVLGILSVLGIEEIVAGAGKIGFIRRFRQYMHVIGSRSYVTIEELAARTGRNRKAVIRDLQKMMQRRIFLHGCIDEKQTTFMLTQDAYAQYQQAEAEFKRRQEEEALQKKQEDEIRQSTAYNEETKKILAEGNAYIQMIHTCNDKIPDEVMSGKLDRLENIMRRIFAQVEKKPSSAEELHKFMSYYLPTTQKLLYAYIDLDEQPVEGQNIANTKREIAETLDIINTAYENLLDSLFEDTAWDISSDISVMKTMLAQEGLTGSRDFKK